MTKNDKADLRGIGFDLKTNFTGSETEVFSSLDYHNQLESVQSIIERITRPGKVIRLYRCFSCNRHYASSRLSTALVVCKDCLKRTQGKGRFARQNVIDRITNDIRKFLRGRLEVR